MKHFIAIIMVIWLVSVSWMVSAEQEADKNEKPKDQSICPVTKMSDNNKCLDCHAVTFKDNKPVWGLREIDPSKAYQYPTYRFRFCEESGKRVAYLFLPEIDSAAIYDTFTYLDRHPEVNKLVIELHNPGGSMMSMWRIVGLMNEFKAKGKIIETRCHGFAASAAFIVFANGSLGHRFVDKTSLLMWHEVMSFSMFSISTPSSSEDEAATMRMFQDLAHEWLADRCKLSKDELSAKVRKREWWMKGWEAVDFGIADGLITDTAK